LISKDKYLNKLISLKKVVSMPMDWDDDDKDYEEDEDSGDEDW